MGCVGSSSRSNEQGGRRLRKPKPWNHTEPLTNEQLEQMREEFWDTAPYYNGKQEIWEALRAAAEHLEENIEFAQTIIDSAGIIVQSSDMTICYDERGAKYELPKYVVSVPSNMIQNVDNEPSDA
ncbi:ubiquitin domain-containing protein 2-like [Impatiens glandulifera]|uniref:ubiquitin domain-containing protein 2-like n=1 Tax=Impatiens glandulifera TaxID=253017 RepID=UPI001FB07F6D|nr:ubiquitin domain-containing protein 2-like [Impatiens glandulifera]